MAEEVKNVNADATAEQTQTPQTAEPKTAEPPKDNTDYKAEYAKLKASFDRTASEAARFKKELAERSTAEENARRERDERERQMSEELEQLKTERRVGKYTTGAMTWGMDAQAASDIAKTLPDGVADDFFAAVKTFIENEVSRAKAEALNAQPKPTLGAPVTSNDVQDEMKAKLRKYIGL